MDIIAITVNDLDKIRDWIMKDKVEAYEAYNLKEKKSPVPKGMLYVEGFRESDKPCRIRFEIKSNEDYIIELLANDPDKPEDVIFTCEYKLLPNNVHEGKVLSQEEILSLNGPTSNLNCTIRYDDQKLGRYDSIIRPSKSKKTIIWDTLINVKGFSSEQKESTKLSIKSMSKSKKKKMTNDMWNQALKETANALAEYLFQYLKRVQYYISERDARELDRKHLGKNANATMRKSPYYKYKGEVVVRGHKLVIPNFHDRPTTGRKYERTTDAWMVRGHKRKLKNGKEIFVQRYKKGKGDITTERIFILKP